MVRRRGIQGNGMEMGKRKLKEKKKKKKGKREFIRLFLSSCDETNPEQNIPPKEHEPIQEF